LNQRLLELLWGIILTNHKHQQGFSLLELAIVIAIGGVLTIGLLTLGNAQYEQTKYDRTKARMDVIENAILNYAERERTLPCPAPYNSALDSATFGISADCSAASVPAGSGMVSSGSTGTGNEEVWRGAVPVRSLNLDDRFMFDGWNNRMSFAIVKGAATDNLTRYTTTDNDGVITIIDKNGNQITDANDNSVVGYVLISHGKDGAGSYAKVVTPAVTSPTTACTNASTLDGENCDADTATESEYRDMRVADSTNASNYFFDIVRWKPLHFFVKAEVNL